MTLVMFNQLMKTALKTFSQFIVESNDGGDCYVAAGKLILYGDDEVNPYGELYLIHGMVDGQGPLKGVRYDHAWCEDDHLIYDFSNGRRLIFPKQLYYSIGNIDPHENFRYSKEEARRFILDNGTWGPWERVFERLNENVYNDLVLGGVDFARLVFDVPNSGAGKTIIKNIEIGTQYFTVRDNGRLVTLFEDKKLLAKLFYEEEDGLVEIGIIESIVKGQGYAKVLMLYLASKYGYENLTRDILTSSGELMRHELDKFFKDE